MVMGHGHQQPHLANMEIRVQFQLMADRPPTTPRILQITYSTITFAYIILHLQH